MTKVLTWDQTVPWRLVPASFCQFTRFTFSPPLLPMAGGGGGGGAPGAPGVPSGVDMGGGGGGGMVDAELTLEEFGLSLDVFTVELACPPESTKSKLMTTHLKVQYWKQG